jgi:mono/diheme cytochrome c family protein
LKRCGFFRSLSRYWSEAADCHPTWALAAGKESIMTGNVVFGILTLGVVVAGVATAALTRTTGRTQQARVERGRYLVTVGGCNDCHTPLKMGPKGPEPDLSRMLSGHPDSFPIASEWGPGVGFTLIGAK